MTHRVVSNCRDGIPGLSDDVLKCKTRGRQLKKILFLINNLAVGGAEKVLVNLVNNLDKRKYDVTVMTLFDIGVNKQFLLPTVHYKSCFKRMIRGNSHLLKVLSPVQLHRWLIKDHYDIEVAYLEGPVARIISGCPSTDTKLISWIHITQNNRKNAAKSFRNYREAMNCYGRFHRVVAVSENVKEDFQSIFSELSDIQVLYNTNETDQIKKLAEVTVADGILKDDEIKIVGVGKLIPTKGFDRLARIHNRLREEGYLVHTYILGIGSEKDSIMAYLQAHNLEDSFTLLGYDTNPYKYVSKCDIFVCSSWAEGFSTAASEALIVGTPVCSVNVSGMKEMLGYNNEYGIVSENDEEALFFAIKRLLDDPDLLRAYREKARIRGEKFSTSETVHAVEEMIEGLLIDR